MEDRDILLKTIGKVKELMQQRAPVNFKVGKRLKARENIQFKVLYFAIMIIVQSTKILNIVQVISPKN